MISSPYYNALIKKYVTVFGTLFNEIYINRAESTQNQQKLKIPVQYGPQEKFLARVEARPNEIEKTPIQLPRMAFIITGFNYDPSRKRQTTNQISYPFIEQNGTVTYRSVFVPVPYDISFRLSILSKTVEDSLRIVEQILPHFRPELTVTVKLLDKMPNHIQNLPIILNSVDMSDNYDEGDFDNERTIIWNLDFTMKAEFYGPVSTPKIIEIAKVDMFTSNTYQNPIVEEALLAGITQTGNVANTVNQAKKYEPSYANAFKFDDLEEHDFPYFVSIKENS